MADYGSSMDRGVVQTPSSSETFCTVLAACGGRSIGHQNMRRGVDINITGPCMMVIIIDVSSYLTWCCARCDVVAASTVITFDYLDSPAITSTVPST